MDPLSPHDLADAAQLQRLLDEAARTARALAYALAHVQGLTDPTDVADYAREELAHRLRLDTPSRRPRARLAEADAVAGPDPRTAQEAVLALLRDVEGDLSIPQILNVLDDAGHALTANHVSVILTRLSQSGVIDRAGRGRYRAVSR
ncbi:MAG: hypothetical protein IPL88_10885 [Rhizobiales bacterium]|nr:hypothetical protein [Hyphomicrobiales bacterium]